MDENFLYPNKKYLPIYKIIPPQWLVRRGFCLCRGGYGLGEDWALVDLDFGSGISAALTVPAKCYDRIELRRLELK
ncbi:MAG: hypothetical protein ACXWT1_03800 [Methylobacter sp.]